MKELSKKERKYQRAQLQIDIARLVLKTSTTTETLKAILALLTAK